MLYNVLTILVILRLSYSMIVQYSRDHKGVGVAHKKTSPASLFPDNDEAVLVG